MTLPDGLRERLTLPLIAAPMTQVSGVELVVAACLSGVIGAFPTHNARPGELGDWITRISAGIAAGSEVPGAAPFAANLIVHPSNRRLEGDLVLLVEHGVEIVITSVGSPAAVVGRLHEAGAIVLADVGSMRHAQRAIAAGVDGLVLLSAGAGGQTGWLNPLAYIRAVRRRFDGPVVLAGGIADGAALAAAIVAGADLAYMGTRFIATDESAAPDAYKRALLGAGPDDVEQTDALTGLPANVLAARFPDAARRTPRPARFEQAALFAHADIWSAGHSVCGVRALTDVATLLRRTAAEYAAAMSAAGVA